MNLLIVDDEPMILQGLQTMVREAHTPFNKIQGALNGVEALQMMTYFKPDLIITDIQMPGMNGLDFIREARLQCANIIILTGYDKFEYAHQAIRYQVTDYLLKPINEYELLKRISSISVGIMDKQQIMPAEDKEPESMVISGDLNPLLKRFFDFLEDNYLKDLSLEQVASHMDMHPNYLSSLIKRESGDNFSHHLQRYRVDKAKQLIVHTTLTMDQIANIVCFNSSRHFFKVFKLFTNLTPGQYREQNRAHNRL
jgi:two-component system response regulator YesN